MYFSRNLLEKTVDRCHYKAVKKRTRQERFCGESVYSMPYQRGKRVDIMRKCKIMERATPMKARGCFVGLPEEQALCINAKTGGGVSPAEVLESGILPTYNKKRPLTTLRLQSVNRVWYSVDRRTDRRVWNEKAFGSDFPGYRRVVFLGSGYDDRQFYPFEAICDRRICHGLRWNHLVAAGLDTDTGSAF